MDSTIYDSTNSFSSILSVEAVSTNEIRTSENIDSVDEVGTNGLDSQHPKVSVKINGLTATLDNGLINISFDSHATVSSLYANDQNRVENVAVGETFYLDWHNGTFNHFSPNSLEVISESAKHAHIMYLQDSPGFLKLEYHLIIKRGLSGIYTYVKSTNNQDHLLTFGELRVIYRFNPKATHQVTNSIQQGILPDSSVLTNDTLVQDTTWRLKDGTIYTKYDYAGYIRNSPYLGVFGDGYGAWLLSASREYHSGGALKQDLLVHQDALIANYMTGAHFGTPELKAPVGWSKIYGPWLLYFNEGTDDEMKEDAIRQVKVEQDLWPYKWMHETDYPLKRGSLTGRITGPPRSMVVLSSSLKEEFDLQTLGYSYSIETNENGDFQLENIRPGIYKLTAYPIAGYGIGFQAEKQITVTAGANRATLNLVVPTKVKWSIGETNRRSDSYRYSDKPRNYIWHTLPPANLEFYIGKSDIHTDWYYAQTKPGTWNIRYTDTVDGQNRILRIGIAAASNGGPTYPGIPTFAVSVNDHLMNEFHYDNDKSIYRSASQSGSFYFQNIKIPSNLVITGDNVVSLTLRDGMFMYDSINLSSDE
ncbi:rhamnogalacturonate lyase-like [Belonocnema kinseyi]|uniref:rhamnogalacturonate lyase-like n=1 Tax=Belonocnema kinseyi TaxID=2817044 RepID=UPI00143D549A|nr:rhamnogalacturonate lyase-like [Belonocnema kinseyi]